MMNNCDYMNTTLENTAHMTGDYCAKFSAAVRTLNGYNVQGVHCFDCLAGKRVYRVYGGSADFTVRVLEEAQ